MVITRTEPVHALLYFIVSLFAVAVIFYLLGAPFVAALTNALRDLLTLSTDRAAMQAAARFA